MNDSRVPPSPTMAEEIVEKIEMDIAGRKGIGDEWGCVDSDIREEIKASWASIIEEVMGGYAENGRPKYDDSRDENETCKCGHEYYRHFDTYEDMYPIGCKYCDCDVFESDPEGGIKYADEICCECHAKLSPYPEESWCAKCGKVMEPWSLEVSERLRREREERILRIPPEVGSTYARQNPYVWGRVQEVEGDTVRFKPYEGEIETYSVVEFNTDYERV